MQTIPDYAVRAMQDTVQLLGKPVQYFEAGSATGRTIKARVSYAGASDLVNAIEQYPIRVTVDARDFPTRPPFKGDTFVIDNARCAVESVSESHTGDKLVKYVCGVRG
jgi:hypothetical protein